MTPAFNSLAAIVVAYLVGSLSFAVLVSRGFGLADPRSYGSKNPGATNVLRSGHRAAAILTLALDALKGYVPVWLALWLAPRFGFGETTIAFVGLAAFLGHLWPVFFHFEGARAWPPPRACCWRSTLAGAGHAGHLGDHRVVLSVLIAGVDRRCGLRTVLSTADLGAVGNSPCGRGDEPAADLAPQRQHPQTAGGYREQAGPPKRRPSTWHITPARTPGRKGHS